MPASVGALTALTRLSLPHNRLRAVAPELACLTRLTALDMASNQLDEVPPCLEAPPRPVPPPSCTRRLGDASAISWEGFGAARARAHAARC